MVKPFTTWILAKLIGDEVAAVNAGFHQKQNYDPYYLVILLNGIFLLANGIASMLWASQYVFLGT